MELGPFVLEKRIDSGAMGDVWRGTHRTEGVSVAVKFVTSFTPGRGDTGRFRREVRSAAALNHPGIIRIFDFGEVDQEFAAQSGLLFRPGAPYLVMEYADGGTLAAFESELSWSQLRELLVGLLQALGHAHSRGVIHRDLKPSNILLTKDTNGGHLYKISDFGLAFLVDEAMESGSSHERAVGTPYYMAPEQIRSRWRDYGPWTDLYGLGCVVWRLVTGEYPFPGASLLQVAQKHLSEPLPEFDPRIDVPDNFEHWLARLLEKHPNHRFRRAADALWPLLRMPETIAGADTEIDIEPAPTVPKTEVTAPLESLAAPGSDPVSFADPPSGETIAPGNTDLPPRTIDPLDRKLPPVPKKWSQEHPPQTSMPMVGAGLELFDLRDYPMVDREPERNQLWDALTDVVENAAVRMLLLRGPAGVGKSRLARWVRERADQLGAATGLHASHSPQNGPSDGLLAMISECLSIQGLEAETIRERVRDWYEARGVDREHEWRGLTALLTMHAKPDASDLDLPTPDPAASDAGEMRALVRRFLQYVARERPLVIELDDLQWGLESLHFLEHLFTTGSVDELPILFVGTIRDDALAERPLEGRIIESLLELEPVEALELDELNRTDQRLLVEEFLRLTPTAAHAVVDRAGGNPQFAVELVGDWIDRDLLEVTEDGFRLAEGTQPPVPDDLYQIWTGRLDSAVADESESSRTALQIGAALGSEIDAAEWRDACRRADLPFPDRLVDRLLRHDLLEETESGWRFPHNMLREAIERRARESGVWEELNRHCAAVVGKKHGVDLRHAERLARHLLEADEKEAALEPLLDTVEFWGRRGEYNIAAARLETAREVAQEIELANDDELALAIELRSARLAVSRERNFDRADRDLSTLVERSSTLGFERLELEARISLVALRVQASRPTEALDIGRETLDSLDGDNASARQLGRLRYQIGNSALMQGDFDAAAKQFARAADCFEESEPQEYLKTVQQWGEVDKYRGETERAKKKWLRVLEQAESTGSFNTLASCANSLGDCARLEGDFDRAAEFYRKAEQSARLVMTPELHYVFLGRIQLRIEQRKYERALELCDDRDQKFASLDPSDAYFLNIFWAQAAAGAGQFDVLEQKLDNVERLENEIGFAVPDAAQSLTDVAQLADASGQKALVARAARLAADHWRALGESERADSLDEKFELS